MLNQPPRGISNYDEPLNENFATIEDKMQYKATCTYDGTNNVYVLGLLNIPPAHVDELPAKLPDTFTAVARFPNDYVEGAKIRIGGTDFAPKYATFAAGDTLVVAFNQPEKVCFFSSSKKTMEAESVTYSNAQYPLLDNAKRGLDELLALADIYNRIYAGVDLAIKFAAEIAAVPYSGDVWAWIKARIQAANFTGIYIGDYIPFTAGGNTIKAEVAGIDTYYNYGDTAVGHHIDFISRDCWPDTHVFNKANYNNGTTVSPYPWLASDLYAWLNSLAMDVPNATTATPALVSVDYSTTGVYDKLPTALKAVIVTKRLLLPSRYTAGSLLTDENNWSWANAGKIWIPSEVEVYGMEHWGSKNGFSGGGFQQYPIFATNMKRVKGAGEGGVRSHWWSLSADSGNSTHCANVSYSGGANHLSASSTNIYVPVCFRISA